MNALIKNILIGAATLAISAAPLAASAQQWHNGQNDNHRQWHGNAHDNHGYHHPYYNNRWHEGYYGVAPGGFHGYYHNGGWYHHRRFQSGIWLYF